MANFLRLLPNCGSPFRSKQYFRVQGICKCNQIGESSEKKKDKKDNVVEAPLLDSSLIIQSPKEKESKLKLSQTISVQQQDLQPVSFIPDSYTGTRRARIYVPAKNPMQSGTRLKTYWQVDFNTKERWQNPCMGWSSSGDALSNISLQFNSKEDAIRYCETNGWNWYVNEPTPQKTRMKNYTQNFVYNKRTRVSTK